MDRFSRYMWNKSNIAMEFNQNGDAKKYNSRLGAVQDVEQVIWGMPGEPPRKVKRKLHISTLATGTWDPPLLFCIALSLSLHRHLSIWYLHINICTYRFIQIYL